MMSVAQLIFSFIKETSLNSIRFTFDILMSTSRCLCEQLETYPFVEDLISFLRKSFFLVAFFIVVAANLSFISAKRRKTTVKIFTQTIDQIQTVVVAENTLDDPAIILVIPSIKNFHKSQTISSSLIKNDSITENLLCEPIRQIDCFCDGSYSPKTNVSYSGFRTSDGHSLYRFCPSRYIPSASTESEVFAACLALEHTAQSKYDKIVIYTDNSKVEQLLKRPKAKDRQIYQRFFNALEQNDLKTNLSNILVERVPGHPTQYEQIQSNVKREFAKIDQKVREERRKYERQEFRSNQIIRIPFEKRFYDFSTEKVIRFLDPKRFGKTVTITTSLYRSKSFPLLNNDSSYRFSRENSFFSTNKKHRTFIRQNFD